MESKGLGICPLLEILERIDKVEIDPIETGGEDTDFNGDNDHDPVDVQFVINGALGLQGPLRPLE